jgi:hypothetical protein
VRARTDDPHDELSNNLVGLAPPGSGSHQGCSNTTSDDDIGCKLHRQLSGGISFRSSMAIRACSYSPRPTYPRQHKIIDQLNPISSVPFHIPCTYLDIAARRRPRHDRLERDAQSQAAHAGISSEMVGDIHKRREGRDEQLGPVREAVGTFGEE